MKFLGLALLLTFGYAFASTRNYKLTMDLNINGKHTAPKLIVQEGRLATITQADETGAKTFFDIVTVGKKIQNNKAGVVMKFSSGTMDKKGVKHIQFKTKIIALENEIARVNQKSGNGSDQISLSVSAAKEL